MYADPRLHGDTTYGWWDVSTYTLANVDTLELPRHGGLLCDGMANKGWLWLMTTNVNDVRFKNEDFESKSTVWLR